MAKILITGGSGLIGRAISKLLLEQGHEVVWLSREAGMSDGIRKYSWNVRTGYMDTTAFEGVEYMVHLAGAGIVDKRWTKAYKKEIVDSRVKSSELLYKTISQNNFPIKALAGGSAVGYYGSGVNEHLYTESDPPGNDFLADTCVAWEKSYEPFANRGIRTAIIRTGFVLSAKGGAYTKLAPLFKAGLGSAIGSGKQILSWIHIRDLAGIFVHALFHDLHGSYNAVASKPLSNADFSRQLARSLHKPFFLPNIPAFAIQLALGERALTVTGGAQVSNTRIRSAEFHFEFDDLEKALQDLALKKN